MSLSKFRFFALIALGLIALAACSIGGSSTNTPSSSATGSSVIIKTPNATSPAGTSQASSSATPDGISLDPPLLVAHAKSGTQPANFGTFYWMISNGLAAKVNAVGIQIQDKALHVSKGETVQFTWENQNSQSDSTLQSLQIAIFPEKASIVTQVGGGGTMQGFAASDHPITSDKLSMTDPSWKVGVDSGSYFVQVKAEWSNPIVKDGQTRHCEYGFYITVG